ncbi:MAG TPA: hypothetical protein EYQ50_29290 [Verrucomicrobiales bacterium]|nr:hypothetical protein [Verrucomicrobiales bacterium]HIL70775.1 hypothetical protein [Verrucomicrobiota bacterium]
MGLAISRKLIEKMGGTIGVRNNSGQGATFYFSLEIPFENKKPAKPAE